jgi:hypothetical protein
MALRLSTGFRNAMLDTGGFTTIMNDGVLYGYSGGQPTTADLAESGTLLVVITVDSGAFVPGAPANGLGWEAAAVAGVISKAAAETWSGVGLVDGTLGWFRFYANARVQGASTVAVRFDGTIATSGAQIILSSTTVRSGVTMTLDTFTYTLPTL